VRRGLLHPPPPAPASCAPASPPGDEETKYWSSAPPARRHLHLRRPSTRRGRFRASGAAAKELLEGGEERARR
jgi:hypothetical protein